MSSTMSDCSPKTVTLVAEDSYPPNSSNFQISNPSNFFPHNAERGTLNAELFNPSNFQTLYSCISEAVTCCPGEFSLVTASLCRKHETLQPFKLSNSSNSSNSFSLPEDPVSAVSSFPPIADDSIRPPLPDGRTAICPALSTPCNLPDGCIRVVPAGCPEMNRTVPIVHPR